MPVNPFDEVWAALESIETRLDALEAAATRSAEMAIQEEAWSDELAKVAWAVHHGRKRPW